MRQVLEELLADLSSDMPEAPVGETLTGKQNSEAKASSVSLGSALEFTEWQIRRMPEITVRFGPEQRIYFVRQRNVVDHGDWMLDGAAITFSRSKAGTVFVGRINRDVIAGSWQAGTSNAETIYFDRISQEGGDSVLAVQPGEALFPDVSVLLQEGRWRDAAEMIASEEYLRIRLQPHTSGGAAFARARRALAEDVLALARAWPENSEPFCKAIGAMLTFGFDIFSRGSRFDEGKRMLATAVRAAGDAAVANPALIPCYIAACQRVRGLLSSHALWEGPSGDETGTLLENAVEETLDKVRAKAPAKHLDWFTQWDAYWQQRD